MAFHNILSKVDRALVQFIITGGAGTKADVYPAKRSETKALPETVCWSHSYESMKEGPYAGTYCVEAFVEVRTSGVIEEDDFDPEKPKQRALDRTSATFGLFTVGDGQSGSELAEDITTAARTSEDADMAEFTAIDVKEIGGTQGFNPRNPKQQGNAWIDSIHLEILCCPSNVS